MSIIKKIDLVESNILTDFNKEVVTATANLKKLQDQSRAVNKTGSGSEAKERLTLANQLTTATNKLVVAESKQGEELQKLRSQQADLNKLNKANAVLNDKLAGTEEKLAAANVKLRLERKKLNTETKKGRDELNKINTAIDKNNRQIKKNSDALKKQKIGIGQYGKALKGLGVKLIGAFAAIQGLRGAFNALKNIIGATAEGQIFLAKVTGATNAVMATLRDKLIDAFNALVDFGKETIDTRSFIEKLGDAFFNFYSVRGEGFLKFLDAGSQILKGDFSDALTSITDGFVQVAFGVENATKKTTEFLNNIQKMAEIGAAIAVSEKKLALERSQFVIIEAKDLATISELRVKAEQRDKFAASERQKFLEEAIALQKKVGNQRIAFANREAALQRDSFNLHKSNIDEEIQLNLILAKANEEKMASTKKLIALESKLQTTKREAANETKANLAEVVPLEIKGINQIKSAKQLVAQQDELSRQQRIQKLQQDRSLGLINEQMFQEQLNAIKAEAQTEAQEIETEILGEGLEERQEKIIEDNEARLESIQEFEEAAMQIKVAAVDSFVQIATDIFDSFNQARIDSIDESANEEKAILDQQLADGEISQEEHERKIAAIEKKARLDKAKAERTAALWSVAINTIVSIAKTLATAGIPAGIPLIILAAALGALQVVAILAKPLPTLAEGDVNIKAPSHAQGGKNVNIEGGESYINKHATQQSMGILEAVNAGILRDDNIGEWNNQDVNMLLAGLLMQGNKNSNDLVRLMENMGWSYDRDGMTEIRPAIGRKESFPVK